MRALPYSIAPAASVMVAADQKHKKKKNSMKTYKIIKFTFNGSPRLITRGLTLEEAQAHCSRDDTHGEGWFHGYEEE